VSFFNLKGLAESPPPASRSRSVDIDSKEDPLKKKMKPRGSLPIEGSKTENQKNEEKPFQENTTLNEIEEKNEVQALSGSQERSDRILDQTKNYRIRSKSSNSVFSSSSPKFSPADLPPEDLSQSNDEPLSFEFINISSIEKSRSASFGDLDKVIFDFYYDFLFFQKKIKL